MKNANRPAEDSIIAVEPIRSTKDITTIKKMLDNPRDYALFVMGINTAFQASDLLQITVGQVRHLEAGDTLPVREQKTGKETRKGGRKLTVSSLNNMVKKWCLWCNLAGNYGSHAMRKTFGYHHRVTFGTDLPTLMKVFGHATQAKTLHYLGIQEDDVKDAFIREL